MLTTGRDTNWPSFFTQELEPFWSESVLEWIHQSNDGQSIHYMLAEKPENKKLILLLPGRSESYLKYKELIFDFVNAGFNVFCLDHRGQGQSSRELKDKQKGHINNFHSYADDLHQITLELRLYKKYNHCYMFAHSMGAAIALDYNYRYQPKLEKLSLCAPLLGISSNGLPQFIANLTILSLDFIDKLFKRHFPYFLGQKPHHKKNFNHNQVTHSKARFDYSQGILNSENIKLGGFTTHWLHEIIDILEQLHSETEKLCCPVQILQAEKETVVSNSAQKQWQKNANASNKQVSIVKINSAKHEILQEIDNVRKEALNSILVFLNNN